MRVGLCVVLVLAAMVCVPGVFAVVVNENNLGPSTVTQLDTPVPGTCGQTWLCPDANFTAQTDFTTAMADGSTVAGSQINVRSNNGAGRAAMLYWAFDIQATGNYSLRILPAATFTLVMAPYVNATHVNTSFTQNVSLTSSVWTTVDVNRMVRDMHASLGDVRLRFWTADTVARAISEVYLVQPPSPGQFQIIDQGARIARTNAWVENEWLVITPMDKFRITNATCSIESLVDNAVNITLNVTTLRGNGTAPDKLRVRWFANSTYVVEGRNYEIECDANFDGVRIQGLEQYVYITQEGTAETVFSNLMRWIKALFVDLTVQTSVVERSLAPGVPQQVIVEVLRDKQSFDAAACRLWLYNGSNMGVIANNVSMSYYQGGFYNYTFTPSVNETSYVVRSNCVLNNTENVSGYQASGMLSVASAVLNVSLIYEGTPKLTLLQGAGFAGAPSQIMAQLIVGSNAVTNAACNVTVYYPANTTKVVSNQPMSYSGDDGMYNYTWTPPQFVSAVYPARVECRGGSLGTLGVQASTSVRIDDGVYMQSVT